ncbi:MAG: hypothetical protein KF784_03170 [Fimbriimonadaceae bacterium]|nr:hypothetical protein [Fimbriimonadaceae bacterium]
MKPLLFLSYKSFLNGLIRAFSSPRRIIGALFFLSYYFFWFIRPTMGRPMPSSLGGRINGVLEFPPLQIIDALVFGIFALLTMFLMMGTATQTKGFQAADVDILFPTPIHPRIVLVFRMARDYFLTLFLPFLILLLGFQPVRMGWEALFRNMPNPEYSGMAIRLIFLSWILLSMVWISINYALSLAINRSDTQSDRNRKILGWSVGILVVVAFAHIGWEVRQSQSSQELLSIAGSPVLRTIFFTASLATRMTMAAFQANIWNGLAGFGGLLTLIVVAFGYAFQNAGWMYDQAAVRGFKSNTMRDLQRKGDSFAMLAEHARSGKVKAGRARWMFRLRWQGAMAIVWKEIILQVRGLLGLWIGMGLLGLFICLLPVFLPSQEMAQAIFYFVMQASAAFMATTALAQTGFIEVLRRVDLQKPLPFKPQATVAYEVLSKALLGSLVCLLSGVVALIIQPSFWSAVLGGLLLMPCFTYLLSSTMFLVIMLFPDVDDASQRQFRGMMMMIGTGILSLPGVVVFGGLWALGVPIWIAGAVAGGACVGIGLLASWVAGGLYASFNPSE